MHTDFDSSGALRRRMRLLVTTRPVAWLSARYLPEIDRLTFRLSKGRLTPSAWLTGLPVIQMTTTGARTGAPRVVRLLGIPDGTGYLVVAANFGDDRHPAWYHNVRAHPRVVVTTEADSRTFGVRELGGPERDAGFERALELNPGWTRFRRRVQSREIPVLRLIPV